MNIGDIKMIECPICGHKQKFIIYKNVNTKLNYKECIMIRTGEAFNFTCDICREKQIILYKTLYHKIESKLMIHLVTNEEEFDEVVNLYNGKNPQPIFEDAMKGYLVRIVTNINELNEKLIIFEHYLDDRIIEAIKLIYMQQLIEKNTAFDVKEVYFDISEDNNYSLKYIDINNECINISFNKDIYNEFDKNLRYKFPKISEELVVTMNSVIEYIA